MEEFCIFFWAKITDARKWNKIAEKKMFAFCEKTCLQIYKKKNKIKFDFICKDILYKCV